MADGMTAQQQAQMAAQQNAQARAIVRAVGLPMMQQIASGTITNYVAGQAMDINIPFRNVGLIRRIYVEINATVSVGAAETQTLTPLGPANVFSNVTISDYSNFQRVNTTGWHLDLLATVKGRAPFAAAYTTSNPVATGANFPVKSAISSYTAAQNLRMMYEIPLAVSDEDLTGAMLSQVVNSNAYMKFTINPNFFVSSTGNPVQAVYKSSTAQLGTLTSFTYTVYQDFIDQLPRNQDGSFLVPAIDTTSVYGLFNTTVTALAANQDNPYNYQNFRSFLSTLCIYDNAGVMNAGTDVNRFKLQAANQTNIFDLSVAMIKMKERKLIGDDMPVACYWHDFRTRPISTNQTGNMQLLFNPSAVSAGAQLLTAVEYVAQQSAAAQAGSVLV